VAAYGVDIEIGVKGQQRLQSLTSAINLSAKAADSLAKSLGERGIVSQSIDNYSKALQRASRTLQGVTAGTQAETKAIKEYATALNDLAAIQERQKKLVGAEFRATAAGQAELELTKAKKSLEIKRKQGELQAQQDRDREAIQKALGRMEFEQAARRRELLAQGTRELKKQLELSRQIQTVEKRPTLGGDRATAFGPQPDRTKRFRRAEIFDRTAAARRENEERRKEFLKLEEAARGARIKAAREENRNFQQLTADKLQGKKDEIALQKALGRMEERSQAIDRNRNRLRQDSFKIGKKIVSETIKDVKANKKRTEEIKKQNALQRQQRDQRLRSAVGSGLIGGGFPLLFGQTGAAAVGGSIGGLAGGLVGGEFGFALSVVGTAIGKAVAEAEKFDKALAAVNAKAVGLGSATQASAKDVENLGRQLGITKDEVLELVEAFSEFESFADKQALVAIFGDDSSAFNRLAAVKTELDLAKEIFATRDDIGVEETKRLLNMLKIQDASVVELALAEARLQAEHNIAVEKAKQVTLMDRLTAGPVGPLGLGGGVGENIDPAEFGRKRAAKLEEQFQKNSKKSLEILQEKLKVVRDLLGSVESFEPPKSSKKPTQAESGESIEQSLRKQLARYEEIEPFARKRAMVEADHQVTLEKITKVKDKIKKKDLEILAGQLRQARLDDIRAQKAEEEARKADKRLRERLSAASTKADFEMRLATAQAGLPGSFDGPFGGSQETAFLGQQEINLELQQKDLEIQDAVTRGLTEKAEKLKAAREEYVLYETQILQATVAQEKFSEALALTRPVTDSLFNSLMSVVEGTKTAEEAFAGFLRSIASMLFDVAKQMIATYIAIGIARMFAGVPGSGGNAINPNSVSQIQGYSGIGANTDVSGFIPRANGGPVGAGQAYLVGERGPELFVPGAQGNIVPNSAMGSANVTVNVDASGSSVEGDGQNAAQLGKAIGLAVQTELRRQQRPGGILAR
jgi:hypothetical protein